MLEERFRALGEMIAEFPEICESSRFVFVPGPTDPGSANIFPRPPLPDCVVGAEEFKRRVPHASFVSNPCRLQYCSQVRSIVGLLEAKDSPSCSKIVNTVAPQIGCSSNYQERH